MIKLLSISDMISKGVTREIHAGYRRAALDPWNQLAYYHCTGTAAAANNISIEMQAMASQQPQAEACVSRLHFDVPAACLLASYSASCRGTRSLKLASIF